MKFKVIDKDGIEEEENERMEERMREKKEDEIREDEEVILVIEEKEGIKNDERKFEEEVRS